MSNQVYANGMEVSCKQAAGKSICAFPDVCMTPPQTPATPPGVPIPYPNTGLASDTSDGSTSVKISDQEAMLKNASNFKKSTGDEAGSAPMKGVVTHKIQGKVFFIAWSMDVKFEGENAVRMSDMTTHNHGSQTNTPPMVYFDEVAIQVPDACEKEAQKANEACQGASPRADGDGLDCTEDCKQKQKCILIPKKLDKKACCNPDTTGHHMVEDHWIKGNSSFSWYRSDRGNSTFAAQSMALTPTQRAAGMATVDDAPCVCSNESRSELGHQEMHNVQGVIEESYLPGGARHVPNHPSGGFTYGEGKKAAIHAHDATYSSESPEDACGHECMEAQMDAFYQTPDDTPLNRPVRRQPLGPANRATTGGNWSGVITGGPK